METSELQTLFARLEATGFDNLTKIATASRTAFVCSSHLDDGQPIVLKIFQDVEEEGIRAEYLFELEYRALDSLSYTGRVPEIIFSSNTLKPAPQLRISQKYFIVKPYYEQFLAQQRNSITPLELLERAVQEVYISDQLYVHGWRDLDGDFGNDAVNENGMLVRVDLDAAQSRWAVTPKFGKLYHTKEEKHLHTILLDAHRKLLSSVSEVRSLAIRLSRLFLKNEEEEWDLLEEISKLRGQSNSTSNDNSSSRRRSFLRLKNLIKKVEKKQPQVDPIKSEDHTVKKWLFEWERALAKTSWLQGYLTSEESRFLGLIFYHILRQEDPDFTIRDLYNSLAILLLTGIDARAQEIIRNKAERTRRQFAKLVESLFEIRRFFDEGIIVINNAKSAHRTPHDASLVEQITIEAKYEGGFWGAIKSKGSDWKSQDVVLAFTDGPGPALLLADGATGASGDRAIEIAKEVFSAWYPTVHAKTLSEAKEALFELIQRIHIKLLSLHRKSHRYYETTVVVVYIYKGSPTPTALLIRYGDSGFLITHERPDGSIFELTGTMAYDEHPPSLGSRLHSILNPYNEIQAVPLNQQGVYRIRAYSDGLGGESYAWQLLGGSKSIQEIVNEAAQWPSIHPQIGADDWSVAGFDIEVCRDRINTEEVVEDSTSAINSFIFDLEYCNNFDIGKFPLSQKALRFWTNSYADYLPTSQYPLLKRFPDTRTKSTPASSTAREDTRRVIPVGGFRYLVFSMIIAIIVIGAWFGFKALSGNDLEETPGVNEQPPNPWPPEDLKFENSQQERIYSMLKSHQVFILDELPGKSAIDQEPLKSFIPDLGRVLRDTKWRVIIEVHTDLTGSPGGNRRYSDERANAIRAKLPNCEVKSMGDSIPRVAKQNREQEKRNRRLEVYIP